MVKSSRKTEPAVPKLGKNTGVAKERKNTNISGLGMNFKIETGPKTGVELRYHKNFTILTDEEKAELLELRPPKKGKFG